MRGWLLEEREKKGLSQAEMAKRIGISESYYSLIEAGHRQRRMDITLVSKLSSILELPLGRVIDLEMQKGGG